MHVYNRVTNVDVEFFYTLVKKVDIKLIYTLIKKVDICLHLSQKAEIYLVYDHMCKYQSEKWSHFLGYVIPLQWLQSVYTKPYQLYAL